MDKELIDYLSGFVTEERMAQFERISSMRTKYVTVALENIYQAHNASAVLRNCDCFGVQDVHIIENRNEYQISNDVAMGSQKWLNIQRYNQGGNSTKAALGKLRADGYRIIATTPHTNDVDLDNFDIGKGKFALFFGTELNGLSDEVLNNADEYVKIPMYGFTESFNISVSAALCLNHLMGKIRNSDIQWQLTEDELYKLRLYWLRQSIKRVELIEQEFNK